MRAAINPRAENIRTNKRRHGLSSMRCSLSECFNLVVPADDGMAQSHSFEIQGWGYGMKLRNNPSKHGLRAPFLSSLPNSFEISLGVSGSPSIKRRLP